MIWQSGLKNGLCIALVLYLLLLKGHTRKLGLEFTLGLQLWDGIHLSQLLFAKRAQAQLFDSEKIIFTLIYLISQINIWNFHVYFLFLTHWVAMLLSHGRGSSLNLQVYPFFGQEPSLHTHVLPNKTAPCPYLSLLGTVDSSILNWWHHSKSRQREKRCSLKMVGFFFWINSEKCCFYFFIWIYEEFFSFPALKLLISGKTIFK